MAKDKVHARGDDKNKSRTVYFSADANNVCMFKLKTEAYNDDLVAAMGFLIAAPALTNKKVHKETHAELVQDWGCTPAIIEYQDGAYIGTATILIAPSKTLSSVVGKKYHQTLDILRARVYAPKQYR